MRENCFPVTCYWITRSFCHLFYQMYKYFFICIVFEILLHGIYMAVVLTLLNAYQKIYFLTLYQT